MRSNDLTVEEVERYADGEMSAGEAAEVDQHLRLCTRCAAAVVAALQLKRAVREAMPRHELPPGLRDRIASGEANRAPLPAVARRSNAPWWIATAAVFALVLLSLAVLRGRAAATTREFADMHATLLASANPIDVISTDKHTVKPWFEGRVPFAVPVPDLAGSQFRLIGGRVVFWHENTGAYLLVGKGAHRISVFVFPAVAVPRAVPIPSVSTLSWRSGDLEVIAVADVPRDDLVALRRAFER